MRAHGYCDAHARPLASDNPKRGSWRTTPAAAWQRRFLELNPANSVSVLTLDVDSAERILDLLSPWGAVRPLPGPNWTVVNPGTGHGHPSWCLGGPVHLNRASSLRPQLVIAKIAEYYRAAVEADEGYAGVLSRNPYQRRGGRTYWGRMRPYTLEELGAVLPRGYRLMRQPCTAIGRNVGLFRALSRFAGSYHNRHAPLWPVAETMNETFSTPLGRSELRSIVGSVSRYRDRQTYYAHDSAAQAERGRASGAVRRRRNEDRDRRIMRLRDEGWTQRAIAAEIGVSKTAIAHILKVWSMNLPR